MTLTVLHVLRFDAERKLMSVIVKYPGSDDVVLLCKGADSAVIGNLAMDQDCMGEWSFPRQLIREKEESWGHTL